MPDGTLAAKRARILLEGNEPSALFDLPARAPPHAEVRRAARARGVSFVVFDGAQAFLASPVGGGRDARFAITQDGAMVRALEDQFDLRWESAAAP